MTEDATPLHDWLSLAVDALTPIAVVLIGFLAKRYADRLQQRRDLASIRTRWRIEVARELLDELNILYQFFNYNGEWRNIDVDRASRAKRTCDRLIATNSFLWSTAFCQHWEGFKSGAFVESVGPGRGFLFRANVRRHREKPDFKDEWEARFVPSEERITREEFRKLYQLVVAHLAIDLGIR